MSAPLPSRFIVYPAIDLRGGRVVRLQQGDLTRETVHGDDPAVVVRRFAAAGAEWIHVVDLDGAVAGERRQTDVIRSVLAAPAAAGSVATPTIRFQVAGGLRTRSAVSEVLAAGASRVVLGTAALADADLVADLVTSNGTDRIAIALDVRDGLAVGSGWVQGAAGVPVDRALTRLLAVGTTTFVVTAIERDGLLGGPDLGLLSGLVDTTRGSGATIVASGGIASVADLQAVRAIGCRGAIVGRALYDGAIDLADAIAAMSGDA